MPVKNEFESITQKALAENIESLTVVGKKPRGRPKKTPKIIEDEIIVCPKCGVDDPGDWTQCGDTCPMPESPWYKSLTSNAAAWFAATQLPEDTWGKWKRFNVLETSKVFLEWFAECEHIVLTGWHLKIRNMKKYIHIYMTDGTNQRPFAFVKKSTGDIHTPATKKYPFEHFVGNISDINTRLSVITSYGIQSHWGFLPTHPNYKESIAFQGIDDYTDPEEDE